MAQYQLHLLNKLGFVDYERIFKEACRKGYLEVAQWLQSANVNIHSENDEAFKLACENGHLYIAQWLQSCNVNIHSYTEEAFRRTCGKGQLEVAQWLYSLNVDIHAYDEHAFRWACSNGQLEVAQWLKSLNVDIHACDEQAFRWACESGHLDVAQWLYQFEINLVIIDFDFINKTLLKKMLNLGVREIDFFIEIVMENECKIKELIKDGVDYEILDHYAFKRNCYKNKIKIVKFLSKINARYYFEIDNNKIINYEVRNPLKNARNID